jgi:thioredoxin reductase
MHGYLARDGIHPSEFLKVAREELHHYGVEIKSGFVESAYFDADGYHLTLRGGERLDCRKLLLATGVRDELPDIPGVDEFYGRSIHHCPYCDGWEWRDQPVAVFGSAAAGTGLARSMLTWTRDVVLLTGGRPLSQGASQRLQQVGISVRTSRIVKLEGRDGMLERIIFRDGSSIERRAIFFTTGQTQKSNLPAQLGCVFNRKGAVRTSRKEEAGRPGLYVAGDASHDVQFVIVAAAEGAKAAVAMNKEFEAEERG